MSLTVKDIAEFIGGNVHGDEKVVIKSVARIDEAKQDELSFIYLPAYEKYHTTTKAAALIVKPDFPKTRSDLTYIECNSPDKAFFAVLRNFFSPKFELKGVDITASISPSATIGNNVAIGKNVVISDGCVIGDNTKIFHNSTIFNNVEIGSDCLIFSNITIRENCKIGNRVIIHSGTVIGSDGFGYTKNESGKYEKIPQIGNVIIEDDVEIGANVTIDRAAMGSTIIKKGSKLDNLIQIAHNVVIGENTAISAQSGISGSSKVGNNCILAGQVGIADHLEIADNVIIMAQSGVSKSISKSGYYFGTPAKEHKTALKLEAHFRNLPDYIEKIKKLEEEINELKQKLNSK
ncbi:MAG: UDP-3-O-(3-hydroxymyristoyl)glucosamine N-acyltransferase [Ignavibacterium sp.]|nr:UDP-3-O-(3-hydroxymyristoyl)glucosamine N-acyltransferase [Ignavibacterium sp.]MDW8374933.1 UDP-3-O-(3-hydroxymyristoyl)glucosamine N-acyltransferase [Ignavibacteriales bacterium]